MDPDSELQFDFSPFVRLYKKGRVDRLITTSFVPAFPRRPRSRHGRPLQGRPHRPRPWRLRAPLPAPRRPRRGRGGGGEAPDRRLLPRRRLLHRVGVLPAVPPLPQLPRRPGEGRRRLRRVPPRPGAPAPRRIRRRLGLIAMRATKEEADLGFGIKGLVLLNPYFAGEEPGDAAARAQMESVGRFVCAGRYGIEHPHANPSGWPEQLKELACERVLVAVAVAERNHLRERGSAYAEGLRTSGCGGELDLHDAEGEPRCDRSSH